MTPRVALEWLQLNAPGAVIAVGRNDFVVFRDWRAHEDWNVWAQGKSLPEAVEIIRAGAP